MKRGLIVYLAGGAELPEGFDLLNHCREMGFTADRVEIVGSRQGFYEERADRLFGGRGGVAGRL